MPKEVIQHTVSFTGATQISSYKSAAIIHTTVNKPLVNDLPISVILHYLVDKSKGELRRYFIPVHEQDVPRLEGVVKKRIMASFSKASGQIVYIVDVTGIKLNSVDSSKTFHKGKEGNIDRIKEALERLTGIANSSDASARPFISLDTKRLFLELVDFVRKELRQ